MIGREVLGDVFLLGRSFASPYTVMEMRCCRILMN